MLADGALEVAAAGGAAFADAYCKGQQRGPRSEVPPPQGLPGLGHFSSDVLLGQKVVGMARISVGAQSMLDVVAGAAIGSLAAAVGSFRSPPLAASCWTVPLPHPASKSAKIRTGKQRRSRGSRFMTASEK